MKLQVQSYRSVIVRWVDRYVEIGIYGFGIGVGLCIFALFNNPALDPLFSWLSLPSSLRLPLRHPVIGYWPLSYTMGVWLLDFVIPALFIWGYRRFDYHLDWGSETWMVGFPALVIFSCITYCTFFWPKFHPPTRNVMMLTWVCWVYCWTYLPFWSYVTFITAGFGALGYFLDRYNFAGANYVLIGFGLLAFPLGIPALWEAIRRHFSRKS